MITRRKFVTRLVQGAGASLLLPTLQHCRPAETMHAQLGGPDAALGHRLRTMDFGPPVSDTTTGIVIIGGGVAGLSAARYLKRYTSDFTLLELAAEPGGNAIGGQNAVSRYPWGAHYLPMPNDQDPELVAFLQEAGIITGYTDGLPVYNEYHLCFDPQERLYINGYWQAGLVPREGIPVRDRDEIERFLARMHEYKEMRGSDGREAFAIPVANSSQDPVLRQLDTISMETFLTQHNFTSPFLRWYIQYCCADDFGSAPADTSAWAAIHYFASRKGKAANASSDTVLTWPEGNGWLTNQLQTPLQEHIHTRSLVHNIQWSRGQVAVTYFDATAGVSRRIRARAAIVATPQFIARRLLGDTTRTFRPEAFQYAPWMVANVTTTADLTEKRGEPVCWDNVLYGSESLGYVNAVHQKAGLTGTERVLTYYLPLLGTDALARRQQAQRTTADAWTDIILADLQRPHPGIEQHISSLDLWIWGHGMIRPAPGFIWGTDRPEAARPLQDTVYFAHSDVSGLSIFEEAFYQGHTAARQAWQTL
ncbi:FAD-dependent oxidoreductase [Fulvivirgaceae bacterium PWU5]|uniref:FAD-dependent oxidoreductase n=1 Tax=Dawidia cretensis TaxID=2782350 RepID=A0AAP2GX05_9BACT|nr:NAD(P)/FAD-dependent oxidoreductase [Dawidia cretensis]MBT1711897.1 FAD-dependent oxidoreductase [Dawidia cretensis]